MAALGHGRIVLEVDMTDRGVFISYRRRDSSAHAGRLNDDLTKDFGLRVFMDIEDIRPGDVFTAEIESEIKSSCAMIVVIGPQWLDVVDKNGARRLDDPDDPVRRELATAFRHKIAVFPVLVGGAQPPDPERLPPDIAKLAKLNALELSDTRWSFDVQRLVDALKRINGISSASKEAHLVAACSRADAGARCECSGTCVVRGRGHSQLRERQSGRPLDRIDRACGFTTAAGIRS